MTRTLALAPSPGAFAAAAAAAAAYTATTTTTATGTVTVTRKQTAHGALASASVRMEGSSIQLEAEFGDARFPSRQLQVDRSAAGPPPVASDSESPSMFKFAA